MTQDNWQSRPRPGSVIKLAPGLRMILADNPSPMTHWGTNTYILGQRALVVIDPGPDDPAHLAAILKAVGPDQHISKILVTHSHKDHSPLARPLSDASGAPILGFGASGTGRSAVMDQLAAAGLAGGGEGIDADFAPDQTLGHGARVAFDDQEITVLHTPGHLGNHLCFAWGDVCFTGDHVMGWASSLVSPPDGDLTDFMASCHMLAARDWRVFYSAHGAPILDPAARLAWLIDHRKSREAQILKVLAASPATAHTLTAQIYRDIDAKLLPAAERNVLAHLVDLYGRGVVSTDQAIDHNAIFIVV
ncbi:MBL fold metallo-hydrolase [Cognatishimia sp. SS12]|uniref:MBL fold metallo-hydrolase n=1 Tax=Cognatishimia sp. SS12 TaxID=2979465 RepID=UPI00232CAB1C|nr:MBL fold metallo-hydrolase [Cognatishimia sp. SS12]MDC0737243.1 MBL fold metallo-hydrolase [Cognatishimia sp. SS12]